VISRRLVPNNQKPYQEGVRTDYVAGYKAFARSEPELFNGPGREMDAKESAEVSKKPGENRPGVSAGVTLQSVRHAYKAAKETDIYHMIRQRGGYISQQEVACTQVNIGTRYR